MSEWMVLFIRKSCEFNVLSHITHTIYFKSDNSRVFVPSVCLSPPSLRIPHTFPCSFYLWYLSTVFLVKRTTYTVLSANKRRNFVFLTSFLGRLHHLRFLLFYKAELLHAANSKFQELLSAKFPLNYVELSNYYKTCSDLVILIGKAHVCTRYMCILGK